jgi:hypothetical protein
VKEPFVLRSASVSKHEQRIRSDFETVIIDLLTANGFAG